MDTAPRIAVAARERSDRRRLELALTLTALVCVVGSAAGDAVGLVGPLHRALDLGAYLAGGWFAVGETLPRLARGELDVDFLMVLAAAGAAIVGHWHEGGVLLFLFSLSNTLQSYAMDRSRRAIDGLLKRRPRHAAVLRAGVEIRVPLEALRIGDRMIIRPGETVPTDGVVRSGATEMDEATITGESLPAPKGPGDPAYAGALNGSGAVEIEATRLAGDSTLARIVRMVESAERHKARSQRFLERAEAVYARGIVIGVAAATVVPWLWFGADGGASFYRAMVLLVVASPCALVVSTPAAILAAIANGARQGILFKGGAYLENMAAVRAAVFDKTGTLTTGTPGVTDLVLAAGAPPGFDERELLAYAAALESRSEHPLAREVVRAARARGMALPVVTEFVALPGRGVHAVVDGFEVWIGGTRLYEEHGEALPDDLQAARTRLEAQGKSALVLHRELERAGGGRDRHEASGGWLGLIGVADTVRPHAGEAVAALKALGIEHTVMLTGDNPRVAAAVAAIAAIDEVHASLLPEEKVECVRRLQARFGDVMMVGDGINDAPALANAAVGVAMGGAGSDVTLESAHCVLMGDDLRKVAYALDLSRRAVRTVRINLAFSAAVIAVLIGLTTLGSLTLPIGVLGHEGSTVLVCANGLRLLATPRRYRRSPFSGQR
jgi:Cd2+/Zn2+-exporting ATPase